MSLSRWQELALAALVAVAAAAASSAIAVAFLVRIAPDHFVAPLRPRGASPLARAAWLMGKNLLGLVLVVAGFVMALPGVPGQGLLTMFVGLLLLDVPGKRRFELALVRRPAVLRTVNRLRARFQRPPLLVEPPPEGG